MAAQLRAFSNFGALKQDFAIADCDALVFVVNDAAIDGCLLNGLHKGRIASFSGATVPWLAASPC
jgi:hypothetical protein